MKRRFSSQFLGMNSALVYDGAYGYLIDPGVFPAETERILNFIMDKNVENIVLLLTHTHGDHISGWRTFQHFPCYAHQNVAAKSEAIRDNDIKYLQGMWRKHNIEDFDNLIFPDNIQYLSDGEELEIPPFSFLFYAAPGHSTDMSVIIVPGEKTMFSGDMLITSSTPFILHSTHQYWKSLKQIKKLVLQYDIDCLVPGHGKSARSKDDILMRIKSEQTYLQKLILEGIAQLNKLQENEIVKNKLYALSDQYNDLHSHRANVQTFMREAEFWKNDRETDLTF